MGFKSPIIKFINVLLPLPVSPIMPIKSPFLIVIDIFDKEKNNYKETIEALTKLFINNDGLIICAPEYNGSTPPILNNAIAWISCSTDYWRDAFSDKIALVGTSSGGPGTKFIATMKMQLEHLGCVVIPRAISSNNSSPMNPDSINNILNQFIRLL